MSISGEAGSLRALVRAEPLDGVPVLLWKHFRIDEPRQLARRTVDFYRRHRLSAAKIMPDIPLLFEDRSLSSWSQVAQLRRFGPAVTTGRAADTCAPSNSCGGSWTPRTWCWSRFFSPLALIGLWCGPAALREMAQGDRAVAHSVLCALAGVVSGLAQACVAAGADGIYYSCWGQDVLSAEEYSELGVPYDLAGLRGAAAAEFRLLHLHGRVDDVERYAGYPVQVAGWSEVESPLSLEDGARSLPGKFIMGGIAENRSGPADEATTARVAALAERFGPRFVLAPGCSLPDGTGDDALASLRALAGA